MAAAALAAAELRPLDPDSSKARRERLPGPAVPLHWPAAVRAGRGRKLGVERLEQGRVAPRPGAEHAVANRRLERVQVGNPAASELRPHPRKRAAERRSGRRKQRLQLRRADARRLPDLAAAHPAALAPILRENAAILADHRGMLRRRLVRQALQIRRRVRMAELPVLCPACHDVLRCSRPDARRPPFTGLRQPRRDRAILSLGGAFATPGTPGADDTRESGSDLLPPENGMHPTLIGFNTFWTVGVFSPVRFGWQGIRLVWRFPPRFPAAASAGFWLRAVRSVFRHRHRGPRSRVRFENEEVRVRRLVS